MNSQQIEYVLAVAELRSFSKAAKRLYVTQPSLSQYIMKTEQKLGFAIFDRSVNPVELTREGRVFVEYAKRFRELENDMDRELAEMNGAAEIRLGVTPRIACGLLVRPIAELHTRMPDIGIEVLVRSSEELAQMLKTGAVDAAVMSEPCPDGYDAEFLCTERLCLAARRGLLPDIPKGKVLDRVPEGLTLINDHVSSESPELLLSLVSGGAGAAVVPAYAANDYHSDNVLVYPLSPKPTDKKIKLLTRADGKSAELKKLCDIIKDHISE